MIGKQEIIKKLHDLGDALDRQSTDDLTGGDTCYIAADLIKKLSAECDHLEKQLAESKRREKAAVESLKRKCLDEIRAAKCICDIETLLDLRSPKYIAEIITKWRGVKGEDI